MALSAGDYTEQLRRLATNVNPFAELVKKVDSSQHQVIYSYVFILLIVFGSIYLAILIISVSLTILIIYKGGKNQRSPFWLWRRHYLPYASQKVAYIVPNGGLSVILSQIVSSVIFEIYIISSYRSLINPHQVRAPYRFMWLSVSYAPGFYGFWWLGFSALYVCLLSPARKISSVAESSGHPYIPHPIIMNITCLGTPILVTLVSIGWGVYSVACYHRRENAYDALYSLSSNLSTEWSSKTKPNLTEALGKIVGPLDTWLKANNEFIMQFKWASFSWSMIGVVAVVFYSTTVLLFLSLVKSSLKFSSQGLEVLDPESSSMTSAAPLPFLRHSNNPNSRLFAGPESARKLKNSASEKLRARYYFFAWHCGLLTLTLTWYCIVGLMFFCNVHKLATDPAWASLSTWVVVSSSVLLSSAILLQGRRILEDVSEEDLKTPTVEGIRFTTSSTIHHTYASEIVDTVETQKANDSYLSASEHAEQLTKLTKAPDLFQAHLSQSGENHESIDLGILTTQKESSVKLSSHKPSPPLTNLSSNS